jgi:hypothetical protein
MYKQERDFFIYLFFFFALAFEFCPHSVRIQLLANYKRLKTLHLQSSSTKPVAICCASPHFPSSSSFSSSQDLFFFLSIHSTSLPFTHFLDRSFPPKLNKKN